MTRHDAFRSLLAAKRTKRVFIVQTCGLPRARDCFAGSTKIPLGCMVPLPGKAGEGLGGSVTQGWLQCMCRVTRPLPRSWHACLHSSVRQLVDEMCDAGAMVSFFPFAKQHVGSRHCVPDVRKLLHECKVCHGLLLEAISQIFLITSIRILLVVAFDFLSGPNHGSRSGFKFALIIMHGLARCAG